jgi:hypothetical protein
MFYAVTQCPEFTESSSLSKCQTVSRYARKCNFMLGSKKCGLPAPIFTTHKKAQQHYVHMSEKWNSPKPDNRCENYGYNSFTPLSATSVALIFTKFI